jgi:titin
MLFSTDGGATWRKNNRIPYKSVGMNTALDPNDTTRIWYGFFGAGMLHGPRPDLFQQPEEPAVPSNIQASAPEPGKILVTWSPSTGAQAIKGYYVYRSYDYDGYHAGCIGYIASASYEDTDLIPGVTYRYTLRAEDVDGDMSPFSSAATAQAAPVIVPSLGAPTSLAAVAVSDDGIDLSWQDNSADETGFEILRLPGDGQRYELVATVSADSVSYQDADLGAGSKYFYRVRAFNAAEKSYFSNVAHARTDDAIRSPAGIRIR